MVLDLFGSARVSDLVSCFWGRLEMGKRNRKRKADAPAAVGGISFADKELDAKVKEQMAAAQASKAAEVAAPAAEDGGSSKRLKTEASSSRISFNPSKSGDSKDATPAPAAASSASSAAAAEETGSGARRPGARERKKQKRVTGKEYSDLTEEEKAGTLLWECRVFAAFSQCLVV